MVSSLIGFAQMIRRYFVIFFTGIVMLFTCSLQASEGELDQAINHVFAPAAKWVFKIIFLGISLFHYESLLIQIQYDRLSIGIESEALILSGFPRSFSQNF